MVSYELEERARGQQQTQQQTSPRRGRSGQQPPLEQQPAKRAGTELLQQPHMHPNMLAWLETFEQQWQAVKQGRQSKLAVQQLQESQLAEQPQQSTQLTEQWREWTQLTEQWRESTRAVEQQRQSTQPAEQPQQSTQPAEQC